MAIKEQYVNKWRRKNKDARQKIFVKDIQIVEHEHTVITKQMEEDIAFIQKKFMDCVKAKDQDGKWRIIKELQYKIVVRPMENGKYGLVMGRLSLEVMLRFGIDSVIAYVTEVKSKEDFVDMMKRTLTIKTMMPVKAIVKPSVAVSEEEINKAMAYLMKNKDFEKEMVLDPFTYKITSGAVNLYVAERIGLVDVQVKLENK